MQMNHSFFFDFCSGIGGGRLGLESAGFDCVGHADSSRLSDQTYQILFESSDKNYGNINKIKSMDLPSFDMMIAGFPCQSFSVIGRQDGFSDPRGALVFKLLDLASIKKPRFLLFENVRGLLSHNKGATFKKILNSITEHGYFYSFKLLNSLDYGVPQMRQRVYILASSLKQDIERFSWPNANAVPKLDTYLVEHEPISKINNEYFLKYLDNYLNHGRYSYSDIMQMEDFTVIDSRMSDLRIYNGKVPTLRSQRDGIYYLYQHELCELTGYEALLLQGFPMPIADKAKGRVSNRHLLMQAGNAMTVPVIAAISKQINKLMGEEVNEELGSI